MNAVRLTDATLPVASGRRPAYARAAHGVGIVHLGIGAFHRAHQAVYTDDALAASGGDWRILGVSLRGTDVAEQLNPQDGLYTLLIQGEGRTEARVIGSVAQVLPAARNGSAALAALTDPATRIVSLTVTEKAYGIDRLTGRAQESHAAIGHDLAEPSRPTGAIGFIVEALRLRRLTGAAPFTVLCCDNLPKNGALIRAGVLDFAGRVDPALSEWTAENVPFPATMVDRITPAATADTRALVEAQIGLADHGAIETEPFTQWVIEDRFAIGRPEWEAGGALMVTDVEPYELMKLRMLNGTHSMLAYAGFLAGRTYVRDVMADALLPRLVRRHFTAAAATLHPLEGVSFSAYAEALADRFANPAIAHETYQIAMDGTEKLPQRLLQPALEVLESRGDLRPFAFAVASWMRYCLGRKDDGTRYALRDPRETAISAALVRAGSSPEAIVAALHNLEGLFPDRLVQDTFWRGAVTDVLRRMLDAGVSSAIESEAMERTA
ncbi:mannitol dehydrogenase family protein [Rhizobium sp. TRM95111]|uniref:mannitol dehydrogenase family protein n=1 Tax=Rhizobium alarense TaxID=2846851 RepID=UPI001F32D704|nr:mannitol dehydrogenase family protein [Rhizobium alarense]MCF3640263.1 mannitol dehydrogenase family protein [Rhizobium alarense]